MNTKSDLPSIRALTASFPGNDWETISTDTLFDEHGRLLTLNRSPIKHLVERGGVYAILLPADWFSPSRTLPLHAPQRYKGEMINFEFDLPTFTADGYGIIYVGRTMDLYKRIRQHLSHGERSAGGQVKYGLYDCGLYADPDAALHALRKHGRIVFTILSGSENCANRDLLEMSLCVRFAPPFNIKSER
jgi:hypothetical protein